MNRQLVWEELVNEEVVCVKWIYPLRFATLTKDSKLCITSLQENEHKEKRLASKPHIFDRIHHHQVQLNEINQNVNLREVGVNVD